MTLAELLVALILAAIVLGSATSSLLRQQGTSATLGGAAASSAQLRAVTGALAAELSPLAVASGDLVPGEARDTSLQLRAFVAGGAACDDVVGATTIAVGDPGSAASFTGAEPRAGDSLWWHVGNPQGGWRARLILASDSTSAACRLVGSAERPARHIAFDGADTVPMGASLRITRPVRYSFYRSGDGSWQLGFREWVEGTRRFAAPQPVAGPFLMRVLESRSGFRYFAADGAELPASASGVDVGQIALVRVTAIMRERVAFPRDTIRRDSMDVALLSAPAR